MALTVILEDENGNSIQVLDQEISPLTNPEKYMLLKYINPYGDTSFNILQMDDLIEDFNKFIDEQPKLKKEIKNVIELAKKCKGKAHQYLKFYGD